ncbi:MAG: cell division protein FtsQ/DivIB [Succinivibrionaceae bacterium]|nr:cell division protein FtsQ/DivIB [Succinivibrionaceae bacterium]
MRQFPDGAAARGAGRLRGAVLLGMLRRDRRRPQRSGRPQRQGPACVRRESGDGGRKGGFFGFFSRKKKPRHWYDGTGWEQKFGDSSKAADTGSGSTGADSSSQGSAGAGEGMGSPETEELERLRRERLLSNVYWCFGLAFFLAVVAGFAVLLYECKAYLYDSDDVPVDRLIVTGGGDVVDEYDVLHVLKGSGEINSFFGLDVDDIRKEIETIPWVRTVTVRKRWPSALFVSVTIKDADAFWNSYGIYSKRDGIFSAPFDREKSDLVYLRGPEEMADEMWDRYQKLDSYLQRFGLEIGEVDVSQVHSWKLVLKNGQSLILGRSTDRFEDRLNRFQAVYRRVRNRSQASYFDLRYDTGVAIGWKEDEPEENSNDKGRD